MKNQSVSCLPLYINRILLSLSVNVLGLVFACIMLLTSPSPPLMWHVCQLFCEERGVMGPLPRSFAFPLFAHLQIMKSSYDIFGYIKLPIISLGEEQGEIKRMDVPVHNTNYNRKCAQYKIKLGSSTHNRFCNFSLPILFLITYKYNLLFFSEELSK